MLYSKVSIISVHRMLMQKINNICLHKSRVIQINNQNSYHRGVS